MADAQTFLFAALKRGDRKDGGMRVNERRAYALWEDNTRGEIRTRKETG